MNEVLRLTKAPALASSGYTDETANYEPGGGGATGGTNGVRVINRSVDLSERQLKDSVAWYNNVGTGAAQKTLVTRRDTLLAHRAHDRIKAYVRGKKGAIDTVVDQDRLSAAGLPAHYVSETFLQRNLLKHDRRFHEVAHRARVDNAHLAVYFNTLATSPSVLTNVLLRFYNDDFKSGFDEKNDGNKRCRCVRKDKHDADDTNATTPNDECTRAQLLLDSALSVSVGDIDTLSREQIEAMCSANRVPHVKQSTVDRMVETHINDLVDRLALLVEPQTFNMQTIWNSVAYQFLEPTAAMDVFQTTVTNGGSLSSSTTAATEAFVGTPFVDLDPEPNLLLADDDPDAATAVVKLHDLTLSVAALHRHARLRDVLTSKPVKLVGQRLNVMTHRLYSIVLPRQYRMRHGFNTASLDVLLSTLLGANVNLIIPVHALATFAAVSNLAYSNTVLTAAERGEAALRADANALTYDSWAVLLREWERQMWFVVYLELCQRLCPPLKSLRVGCTDDFDTVGDNVVVRRDPHSGNDETCRYVRKITPHHIYYLRGRYYLWWTWENAETHEVHERRFTSTCYRTLIELYWLDLVFRKPDSFD